MRVLVFGLLLISTLVNAEDQYALVDSINKQRSGSSFWSFEAGNKDVSKDSVTLNGSMWHQEYPAFRNVSVVVTKEAQEKVIDSGKEIQVGNILYRTHERVLQTKNTKIRLFGKISG